MKALAFSLIAIALMTGCSKVNPDVTALGGDDGASKEAPIQEATGFRVTLGSTIGPDGSPVVTSANSTYRMRGRVSLLGASATGDPVLTSASGHYRLKGTVKF